MYTALSVKRQDIGRSNDSLGIYRFVVGSNPSFDLPVAVLDVGSRPYKFTCVVDMDVESRFPADGNGNRASGPGEEGIVGKSDMLAENRFLDEPEPYTSAALRAALKRAADAGGGCDVGTWVLVADEGTWIASSGER